MLVLYLEFLAIIFGAIGALLLVWAWFRTWEQWRMDRERITYKLTFPADLKLDTAALLLTNFSGIMRSQFRVAGRNLPSLTAYPSITIEIYSTSDSVMHLLTFPKKYTRTVEGSLQGTIPNIGYELYEDP